MSLQIPAGGLVVSLGDDGTPKVEVKQTLVRLDLWPTWLEIGCVHAEQARAAGERLNPELSDSEKYAILTEEMQAGVVAVTAFAFALRRGPMFSRQLRTVLKELFEFRSRAVHPNSKFVEPNYRPQIDS